ncbi:MAG: NfeD family protein [Phycisphaerae bacterium]
MGLTETVVLVIVLVIATMVLIVAEICTPMFGLLAVLALACAGGAIYFCYTLNDALGLAALIAVIIGLPVYSVAAVKIIPRTSLGRTLFLKRDSVQPGEGTPEADELKQYVGRQTTTETVLRPSGTIRVDGRRIVAQAESGMIGKGRSVRVIEAAGTHVVVREIEA